MASFLEINPFGIYIAIKLGDVNGFLNDFIIKLLNCVIIERLGHEVIKRPHDTLT